MFHSPPHPPASRLPPPPRERKHYVAMRLFLGGGSASGHAFAELGLGNLADNTLNYRVSISTPTYSSPPSGARQTRSSIKSFQPLTPPSIGLRAACSPLSVRCTLNLGSRRLVEVNIKENTTSNADYYRYRCRRMLLQDRIMAHERVVIDKTAIEFIAPSTPGLKHNGLTASIIDVT